MTSVKRSIFQYKSNEKENEETHLKLGKHGALGHNSTLKPQWTVVYFCSLDGNFCLSFS